ncbi:MAG TPA: DUF2079 domain-containing protein [Candidatus Lustribacter sp.]|nr:DUF2079 domain-containing protein [Candidatus Lustribacter sp.]
MFALAAACAVYAVVLTLLGIDRYATYKSGADLGEFVQTIATPLSGFGDTPEGGSHFLHHFSPLLYLFSPVLLLAHSPIALIALQAIGGALVAPPIYLLVRKRADARLALLAACVTLLYPPLVGVTFTEFHENGFAPAAIAWLAWAIDERRWRWAAVFVAAGLAIKEDEALMFVVLGAGVAIWAKRHGDGALFRFATGTAIAGVVTLLLFFGVVRPLVGGHDSWFALSYITNPEAEQHGLAAVLGRLSFLLEAFVPLCFVPLLGWPALLVVPGLLEVLSSHWSITYTMGQHYAGVWVGEMLVAFALVLPGMRFATRLAVASLVICVLNLSLASPTHWRHYLGPVTAHDRVLDAFVAALPPGAAVGTHDEIYSHLGFDPNARAEWNSQPEYILIDDAYPSPGWQQTGRKQFADFARSHGYTLVRAQDGVELYRKK